MQKFFELHARALDGLDLGKADLGRVVDLGSAINFVPHPPAHLHRVPDAPRVRAR